MGALISRLWFFWFPAKEYKIVVVGLDNAGELGWIADWLFRLLLYCMPVGERHFIKHNSLVGDEKCR